MNHNNFQSVGIIDGRKLSEGDALIGLASGIHPNSLSLAGKLDMNTALPETSRSYDKAVAALLNHNIAIRAIGHITGSLYEYVPPMMPAGLTAQIILHRLPHLPIFELIQKTGNLSDRDMYRTFNMGIGMILVVPADQAAQALTILKDTGEDACRIGMVVHGDEGVVLV